MARKDSLGEAKKEMWEKYEAVCEECKKIDASQLIEEEKEKRKQQLWDNFEQEFEEFKSMPGYQELRRSHIEEVKAKINPDTKEAIMKKLAAAKNVDEKVKLFAKITDTFGLETIVSMIPWVGDAGMAIASTVFLIHQGRKIGLPGKSIAKIIGYQALDCAIGAIFGGSTPIGAVIGTLADYLFKSNKKSSELFAEHVRKLEVAAREKGVSEEEIAQLGKKEKEFLTMANSILDAKSKEIKGKGHEKDNK